MKNLLALFLLVLAFVNQSFTQIKPVRKTDILNLDFDGGLSIGVINAHHKIKPKGVTFCDNVVGEEFSAIEIINSFSTLNTSAFYPSDLYLPEFAVSFWFSPNENLNIVNSKVQKTIFSSLGGVIEIFYKEGKLYANIKGENEGDIAINEVPSTFNKNEWYFFAINCKENKSTTISINGDILDDMAMADFKFAKFGPKIALGSSSIAQVSQPYNGKMDDIIIYNYNLSNEQIKTLFDRKGLDYSKPYVGFDTPNYIQISKGPIKVSDPKFEVVICVQTGTPLTRFDLYNNRELIANLPIEKRSPTHHGCENIYAGFIDLKIGENKIGVACQSAVGYFENQSLTVIYEPKKTASGTKQVVEVKPKAQPKEPDKPAEVTNNSKPNAPTITLLSPKIPKNGKKEINKDEVNIIGQITDNDLITKVLINNQPAEYSKLDGVFELSIKLNNGENNISVSAVDNQNNSTLYSFTISRNTQQIVTADKKSVPEGAIPVKDTGKRFALIIGNNNYTNTLKLANPVNDARLMATELKNLGFEVTKMENSSLKDISSGIIAFKNKLKEKENKDATGLFYYAGHGAQDKNNRNFIIPIEAELKDEDALESEGYDLERLLNHLVDASNKLNIVILDACRNNPFARKFRGENGGGLAEVKVSAEGLFIAYATAPGRTADDGDKGNGVYTQELVKELRKPNQTLENVFKNTKANVYFESGKKQMPWETNFFIGDFWFNVK